MRKSVAMIGLICISGGAFSQARDKCPSPTHERCWDPGSVSRVYQVSELKMVDTIRVTLVVYTKIPGFVFTKDGFCVRKYGSCIRHHLDKDQKPVKLPVHVLGCINVSKEDKIGE